MIKVAAGRDRAASTCCCSFKGVGEISERTREGLDPGQVLGPEARSWSVP